MTTLAIIGCGLAAIVIILAVVAVWAIRRHEDQYQDEYNAGSDHWGSW